MGAWDLPQGTASGTYVPLAASGTVTISPKGIANGLATSSNNGAQFGPDTPGTTTSGIQEALTSIAGTGGKILLLNGAFTISSAISITTDYSISIEGVTRGREENTTSSTYAYGVFLMVNGLGAGVQALTINTTTNNLGMLRLSNFTMRGQALGYTGSTVGGMYGITLSGGNLSPAQVEIDNVGFEFVTNPLTMVNGLNGPLIIDWIGFFFCGSSQGTDGGMLLLGTGTCSIQHIEVYGCTAPVLGITGTSTNFMYIDIDSIFCDNGIICNFGTLAFSAPITYLHVGSISLHNPANSAVFRMEAAAGSLYAHIDKMTWGLVGTGQTGQVVQGTGQSTSGQVQITIDTFWGNPQYFIWNNYSATVGAGSFLNIRNATLTAAPTADIKYANMFAAIREVGSNYMQASLSGTTAGTAVSQFAEFSVTYKRFMVRLSGYENTTATAQTITFPYAFTNAPAIMHDDSGGSSVSATTLTLPASMGSTKTGWIVLEGY